MTNSTPRKTRPRLPSFSPVPVKRRGDGWTPVRQAEFIGKLAETGSVSEAAEFVGMARETAYRLRRKAGAEEFARAWDVALAISGKGRPGGANLTDRSAKVTPADPWRRIVDGNWRPVLRRGKYVGSVRKADNSALFEYMAQLDRSFREGRKELRAGQRSQAQNRAAASTRGGGSGIPRQGNQP